MSDIDRPPIRVNVTEWSETLTAAASKMAGVKPEAPYITFHQVGQVAEQAAKMALEAVMELTNTNLGVAIVDSSSNRDKGVNSGND